MLNGPACIQFDRCVTALHIIISQSHLRLCQHSSDLLLLHLLSVVNLGDSLSSRWQRLAGRRLLVVLAYVAPRWPRRLHERFGGYECNTAWSHE